MSLMEILEALYRDGADANSLAHMPCPQPHIRDLDLCFTTLTLMKHGADALSAGCF